jgi:aspartyl-tRNA(Asn)/glutamyl-tRNA(Gln) amidotransferase subunit A
MPADALAYRSITELARAYRQEGLSPVAVVEHLLARLDRLDPHLHAFVAVTRDRALAEARAAESALRGGLDLGPLHGVPYAVKDLFDVRGWPTGAGTPWLGEAVAEADSAAVTRLAAAGMVLLGKTHTVQLAFGGVGVNHHLGTPKNPWHAVPHAPGGSSSGSAVAVAAGLVPAALGTDTGGSVRIPAALCGTVGLKTTVGRISRAGVYPLSWTLDSVGVLTRSVEDGALVYRALQGPDLRDEVTLGVDPHDPLRDLRAGVRGLRLAFAETVFFEDVEPEVERAVRTAGEVLRGLGASVESLAVPEAAEAFAEQKRALFIAAEGCVASAALLQAHGQALDPVVAARMLAGRTLPAVDYVAILRQWAALRARLARTLRDVDALLVPTTPLAARPLDEVDASLETYNAYNLRYLRNTSLGNILNLCAVSVPCGFTAAGLPIGLMVYARPFQEDMALRVAWAYEQAAGWHVRRPSLDWAR